MISVPRQAAISYYLSDYSYSRLIGMAQRHKYIPFGSERAKGLSQFFIDLSVMPFEDTRPPLVKDRHREEEKHGSAPTWLHIRTRRARLLTLTDDAIARYFLVAYQVGIIRTEPFIKGGPDRRTPYPSVALVLEAIGLGWITPTEFPTGLR
jgi:hypothetical protein